MQYRVSTLEIRSLLDARKAIGEILTLIDKLTDVCTSLSRRIEYLEARVPPSGSFTSQSVIFDPGVLEDVNPEGK